ncbi:MAG: glycosyl hydrolase, partial [Saprospiraceae bacterium]|nr:glycosyl hydrolase [Saprospiraceae bacterium]
DQYHDIPGGPIQHDGTGVEIYSTVFSLEESPFDSLTLWAGSDDGLIHITRDGGQVWQNITPVDLPAELTINQIHLSRHQDGKAYVAGYNYRYGDFTPYLFQTKDFGQNWVLLTRHNGIDSTHFIRTIAEDPQKEGLLFAGTEFGLYQSFDDGKSWQTFQLNLPHTPITDVKIHQDNLVMSTQGRGFWILDNLSVLRNWPTPQGPQENHLFQPKSTYRSNLAGFSGHDSPPKAKYEGEIYYWLQTLDSGTVVSLEIIDETGRKVVEASSEDDAKVKLTAKSGLNLFKWDLRYPAPTLVKDLVMMDMKHPGTGPKAPTGKYAVNLTVGEKELGSEIQVFRDPRWEVTDPDLRENFILASEIAELITKSQEQLETLRGVRNQLSVWTSRLDPVDNKSTITAVDSIIKEAKALEDQIYQDQIEVSQDEINYRRLFTNHIIRLYRVVIDQDNRPSQGELERWEDLKKNYEAFAIKYNAFLERDMPTINVLSR